MVNTSINEILKEMNESNSSNYKLEVLKKHKDNDLFKRVLALANDKVRYTFGVTMKNVRAGSSENTQTLEWALDILENQIATREVTGNAAIETVEIILESLSESDRTVFEKILSRDLKINCGRTQIAKVHPGLITKQVYCRCDIYGKKTAKNINFQNGAIIEKKSDGTFKETSVSESVDIVSRSGEQYCMPKFESIFKDAPRGAYIGEMTVELDDELYSKIMPAMWKKNPKKAKEIEEKYQRGWKILDRATGNGLINSDDIPEDRITYELWDFIPFDEYNLAAAKDKKNPPKMKYKERFELLKENVIKINNPQVQVIEHYVVYELKDALEQVVKWMNLGYEGGVLKDWSMLFQDGTSKHQLKLKLEIELDLRIIEFVDGNKGSKNEEYFSAIVIGNDEGTIRTQIGVTTMTEDTRDWFHENRENVIGEIMEVKCNDITIGAGKEQYALSHARYVQMRTGEKTETDTLERAFELKAMAMQLGSIK
jgi:hypothetical protein